MIKGFKVKESIQALLSAGVDLEEALYRVAQENIGLLPDFLKEDPQEISTVLNGVMYFAAEVHPEFLCGHEVHDLVLLRLLPKPKTERFIQELKNA